jgi:protein-disulfide isomerase
MPMRKLLLGLAIAAVVAGAAAFFMQSRPEQPPLVQPLQPLPLDQRAELEKWWDLQPQVTMPFATEPARVVIVKFSDFQCPACRATYFGYQPIVDKYKDRPNDVRFVIKHFPLDSRCNPAVHTTAHAVSCDAAAAAVMASSKGLGDQMTGWFFLHQDELTTSTVRDAARQVAQITDFDARYPQAIDEVRKEASAGGTLHIDQTPTFFINGRKVLPAPTPAALDALIDYELKKQSR